ncbi:MAG: hypothetical protein GY820_42860 [Gammaproteobacteria bacterium]|nr:hypothetical protein [Gammaproteobacteria bacterium]
MIEYERGRDAFAGAGTGAAGGFEFVGDVDDFFYLPLHDLLLLTCPTGIGWTCKTTSGARRTVKGGACFCVIHLPLTV